MTARRRWDPFVTPSSWHGVTTTVFGKCGVGFAPVRPGASGYLINLMEGVEDIPGTVLSEGVKFNWESFPDYLDALASMDRAVDVAAQLPHGALRFYVMGDRGADHAEVPTEREIEEMARLTEEALHAGAMGFTTSRTTKHKARDGRFTPSLSAREAELLGIAQGMKRAGRGVLQVNSDFGPGEFEALDAAARLAGRPLSCLLVQVDAQPRLWREDARSDQRCAPNGPRRPTRRSARAPSASSWDSKRRPIPRRPSRLARHAQALAEERYQRLVSDSELRKVLTEGKQEPNPRAFMAEAFDPDCSRSPRRPDYEPDSKDSIASIAQRTGRTPHAVALEEMMSRGGKGLLMLPFENYAYGQSRCRTRDDHRSCVGARHCRRRRPCRRDLRRLLADLAAHFVGTRPHTRTEARPRIPDRQADTRHGRGLRADGPRPAGAGP